MVILFASVMGEDCVASGLVPRENLCLTAAVAEVSNIPWSAWVIVAAGVVAVAVPGVRSALVNGFRCVRRHPVLFRMPVGIALAYGVFDAAVLLYADWLGGEVVGFPQLDVPMPDEAVIVPVAVAAGAERLASMVTCLGATFPVAALAAAMFLLNVGGTAGGTLRVLRRRFGGLAAFVFLVMCALATIFKLVLIVAFPEAAARFGFPLVIATGVLANALAFVFEFLFGTLVQVALATVVLGWVRGGTFPPARVVSFAVRRMGFVIKWSAVIIGSTLLMVHAPIVVDAVMHGGSSALTAGIGSVARPTLAVVMILLAPIQVHLMLHNVSLAAAVRVALGGLGRPAGAGIVFVALVVFSVASGVCLILEDWTAFTGWRIPVAMFAPAVAAIPVGWMLAAWVVHRVASEPGGREVAY
jgi:hypothetical protein